MLQSNYPRRQTLHFAPKTCTMAENPKAVAVGEGEGKKTATRKSNPEKLRLIRRICRTHIYLHLRAETLPVWITHGSARIPHSKLEKTMKMLVFFCHMSRDRSCRKKLPPSCCVSENPCKGWDHTSPSDSSTKAPSASRALAACHAHY